MPTTHPPLDTANPEHLVFEPGLLRLVVLGGLRLEGLDRMRVTVKISLVDSAVATLRHHLDLYNDTQVEKLIRRVAEKLEVGTSVIGAALAALTDLLEAYRLEEREKQVVREDRRKVLSPAEVKAAQQYLSAPELMDRTCADIGKAGVIGEERNRLLMYLIFSSRKRENPLHIISLGSSGIGKTHLQEKVGSLIPEEDKLEITTLSGNAFYYFGQQELRHKLLLIEDLDGAEDVLYPLREIKSKKRITKTVVIKNTKGETRTVTLTVEGPVSVAGCTTRESLYEDNANRSFLIYIDESKAQDEQIMAYQRKLSAGKVDVAEEARIRELLQNTQRVLQPITVRNPYAEHLVIPEQVFKPRRTNAHYLAFIELVTFYHQYQREKKYDTATGEEYIETTLEDIEQANTLMKERLLRKADPLSAAARSYLERLKAWLTQEGNPSFTNREVRQHFRIKATTLRRYHHQLLDAGLIGITSGKKATGYTYTLLEPGEYAHLQKQVCDVLDQAFGKLRATAPPVRHPVNGAPNSQQKN